MFSSLYVDQPLIEIPFEAYTFQAASGVTSSYDALLDLFESLGNFLSRLDVYTQVPPTPMMTDIIIKVIVELLRVLGIATKEIRQGRFSEVSLSILYLYLTLCLREIRQEAFWR